MMFFNFMVFMEMRQLMTQVNRQGIQRIRSCYIGADVIGCLFQIDHLLIIVDLSAGKIRKDLIQLETRSIALD